MSRKFRVNASRKPVKCKMSDGEFYTRDFPSVSAGKVVVKPQRGNWTVFIGLSDGTIAYQWCESKEKAQREAKYARDTIKRYGADDSYWVAEGYKIWNPNVKSSTRLAKRKSTVKAASSAAEKDLYDDLYSYADQYRMTSRWTKENVTKYLERQKSFRRMTDSDFQRVVDRVNRDFKRNKKVKSNPYSDMSYKSGVESSSSTKRRNVCATKLGDLYDFKYDYDENAVVRAVYDDLYSRFGSGQFDAARFSMTSITTDKGTGDTFYNITEGATGDTFFNINLDSTVHRGSFVVIQVVCDFDADSFDVYLYYDSQTQADEELIDTFKMDESASEKIKNLVLAYAREYSNRWDAVTSSCSTKRRFTVKAASNRPITPAERKRCIDFVARDYGVTKKQAAEWVKEYSDERIRDLLGLESDYAKKAFIYDSTSTKRKRTIVRANASAGNEEIIKELTDWGFDAESDGSALYDMFLDDGYVATVNTSSGEAYISNPDGSEYYRTMILNVNDAADFISIARELDEELGYIGGTDLSAEDLVIDSAQSVECGDAIADRFMVDLMYQKNGGYAEDRYFDDWSEVEAYAHDGLMRGLYARIRDKQTGDTITISPDEYQTALENGAADFDINEDIVNFKNRVITSSTKIQCDGWSYGTYCIVYNGKVIAETDGLYNGLDDCGESEIAEILLMDDAALKACADYVNSFGDPVLTGDEVGDANEVAMVLAEIISNSYAEYKSDMESFGDSISWDGNTLEWFDSSDLADDVTSSTNVRNTYGHYKLLE